MQYSDEAVLFREQSIKLMHFVLLLVLFIIATKQVLIEQAFELEGLLLELRGLFY